MKCKKIVVRDDKGNLKELELTGEGGGLPPVDYSKLLSGRILNKYDSTGVVNPKFRYNDDYLFAPANAVGDQGIVLRVYSSLFNAWKAGDSVSPEYDQYTDYKLAATSPGNFLNISREIHIPAIRWSAPANPVNYTAQMFTDIMVRYNPDTDNTEFLIIFEPGLTAPASSYSYVWTAIGTMIPLAQYR